MSEDTLLIELTLHNKGKHFILYKDSEQLISIPPFTEQSLYLLIKDTADAQLLLCPTGHPMNLCFSRDENGNISVTPTGNDWNISPENGINNCISFPAPLEKDSLFIPEIILAEHGDRDIVIVGTIEIGDGGDAELKAAPVIKEFATANGK